MKLSDNARIPDQVVAREVGEEVVILNLDTGAYFGLDRVGARIWHHLSEGNALNEICDLMAEEFGAPREDLERDILELANDLESENLITAGKP